MQDISDMLARQLRAQGRLRRALLVVAGLGALTAAVLPFFVGAGEETPVWNTGLRIVGLLLAGGIPLLFVFVETTPEELVRELGRAKAATADAEEGKAEAEWERDAIKGAFRRSVVLYETSRAISEATDAVLLANPEMLSDVADTQMLAILDRLIERKGALFGMNDDRWTFGVYAPEGGKLVMRVTRRWSRKSEEGDHRTWLPGEGHVGQAFKTARELVCRDSNDPNVKGFMAATGKNERTYDTELYVSFASVPIMIGERQTPLGVLVATSDHAGRFAPWEEGEGDIATPDTVEPLRVAANVIATILCLTETPRT